MRIFDVAVVGAGPAGCAAAISATDAGLDVVVIDKATFPRDKTCGDGLTTNALRLLEELGLAPDALVRSASYAPVNDAIIVSPSGRRVALPLPSGNGAYAGVIPRMALDAALADLVRATSARLIEGAAVQAVVENGDRVDLLIDGDESVAARWVVAADGHWSAMRRSLQPWRGRDLGAWHAARQYFTAAGDGRLWVIFEPDLLPGYAWVFPLPGGRANVGFGVLRNSRVKGRDLKALWPELLTRPAMRAALGDRAVAEGTLRAWPIPTSYTPDQLVHGRALFAGDAAGVVDSMTGEGIAQAIETGRLAATAIATAGDGQVAAQYRSGVDSALGHDLRFAARLQRVLSTTIGARAAIRVAGTSSWTRRNFARWMFEDYPRAAILTPSRWHRGMFTGAGAYR